MSLQYSLLSLYLADSGVNVTLTGGRAQDAVRSIVISQQMLGTNEIAIYHHTDCGLGAYDDEDIETKVTANFGRSVEAWADKAWYTFKEDGLYQSLVSDVNYLKLHPLVNSSVISGESSCYLMCFC